MTATIRHRTVAVNGVDMHIAEAGPDDGPLVILCHGFPELWYSWRHQLPALADAGYHAVAPDQRGYGQTTAPSALEDYDLEHLTADQVALAELLGAERAVWVGHDWGSILVWDMALRHPDRMRAVVGMSVPFMPRSPMSPVKAMEALFGESFFYIVYFQEPGKADAELGADARTSMRTILYSASGDHRPETNVLASPRPKEGTGFLTGMVNPETLPAWLTEEDVEYFGSEFARTGFTGGINWYRNMHRNWERNEHFTNKTVDMPALFVTGELDAVRAMAPADAMDEWIPDLRGKVVIPAAGHWVQQEAPAETNRALLDFLGGLD